MTSKFWKATKIILSQCPAKKTPEGEYKDIVHPLNTETREMIKKAVLEEFEKVKATVAEQAQ